MEVIIRRERYEVFEEKKVLASVQGIAPHVLLFNGVYWQRVIVQPGAVNKVVRRIKHALRRGQKSIDLNQISGITVSLPKFKIKYEED